MDIGFTVGFQNPANRLTDRDVYANDLRLVDLAVELGFDAVWVVEHHFTDYFMSPDPLQFLTWVAARHPQVRVGTGVIVLPWHEPVRCAEQIALLDNLSGGRLILGVGRGLGRIEFEGFRVDMDTSRERFVEYAQLILGGLESGFLEGDGNFVSQPRREIRPRPDYSLVGRSYAATQSPEAMPLMARLGLGALIVPQKPWDTVQAEIESYRASWREVHGEHTAPPAPLVSGNCIVDADPDRARELAFRYIGAYYDTIISHYGFAKHDHAGVKGYEYYASIANYIDKRGQEGAIADYVNLMPWGTPEMVIEKVANLNEMLSGIAAFNPSFSYADMPVDVAERSLRLFAGEVLPELKSWASEPIPLGSQLPRPVPEPGEDPSSELEAAHG
jgi:alkanesulfonate monooxygenase SsuD/methylene tetrahydromethanopterin reductase-like flavin-dependent oxidoreductase (luciferase family)